MAEVHGPGICSVKGQQLLLMGPLASVGAMCSFRWITVPLPLDHLLSLCTV